MGDDPMRNSETAPLLPAREDQEDHIGVDSDQQVSINMVKSRAMPHTFFDGYGTILDIFAENETANVQTWSRMFVEKYLSKRSWYFPHQDRRYVQQPPSLAKAWAYYEHVTLPRRYVGHHENRDTPTDESDEDEEDEIWERAGPGDAVHDTELYEIFRTPQKALIAWGTGIDLYFISLKFFAAVLFIAGLINLNSVNYYGSAAYNGDGAAPTDFLLSGSAVCTNTAWVACPTCTPDEWVSDKARYAVAEDGSILVLRNLCKGAAPVNAITNFVTLILLLGAFLVFNQYLKAREVRFDEDEVTSSDYSLVVENPPKDAHDPDEWCKFFEQFKTNDQVTAVTVALNNEKLIGKLIQRRKLLRKLRLSLPEGTDMDDSNAVERAIQTLKSDGNTLGGSLEKLLQKIETKTDQVRELQSKDYDVTKVFITFETETSQREALRQLTVGSFHSWYNNTRCLPEELLFRGRVLRVREPCEPNAVRWMDLSAGKLKRLGGRLLTLLITLGILVGVGIGITRARSYIGPGLSGPLTSLSNVLIPNILKLLMMLETHHSEGAYQTSMYLKITLFRWTLTAILAKIITPFTSTLDDTKTDLLPTISHILLADVYIVPIVKLLNIPGNIKMHILGPRARTQEEMNMNFQGAHYNLGERYTDMTKVMFVVFFYSALFPAGFFFGALILTIQYFVDKFSLMRIWGWSSLLGSELAVFSRQYFFTAALITLALVSSYTWAMFPYDNICDDETSAGGFEGSYTGVTLLNGSLVNDDGLVKVAQDTGVVFCSQSWTDDITMALPGFHVTSGNGFWQFSVEEFGFPWMTPSQIQMTTLYGWVAAAVVLLFFGFIVYELFYQSIMGCFTNTYSPDGDSQNIDFSSDPDIYAYVPQVKVKGFPYPFLTCDVDKIDHALIGWGEDDEDFDENNLIYDVPYEGLRPKKKAKQPNNTAVGAVALSQRPIYSMIRHYPTAWQFELEKENKFQLGKKNR